MEKDIHDDAFFGWKRSNQMSAGHTKDGFSINEIPEKNYTVCEV